MQIEPGDICDFCSDPHPTRVYTADTEVEIDVLKDDIEIGGMSFDKDWAACELCGDLLDKGDWDTLLKRASSCFDLMNPEITASYAVKSGLKEGMDDSLKTLYEGLRKAGIKRVA